MSLLTHFVYNGDMRVHRRRLSMIILRLIIFPGDCIRGRMEVHGENKAYRKPI